MYPCHEGLTRGCHIWEYPDSRKVAFAGGGCRFGQDGLDTVIDLVSLAETRKAKRLE